LFRNLPPDGRFVVRDRALLLLLYNTGARVQEVADLCVDHLDLGAQPRVRLHGKVAVTPTATLRSSAVRRWDRLGGLMDECRLAASK
jgi:site-specific recombinase XerD